MVLLTACVSGETLFRARTNGPDKVTATAQTGDILIVRPTEGSGFYSAACAIFFCGFST